MILEISLPAVWRRILKHGKLTYFGHEIQKKKIIFGHPCSHTKNQYLYKFYKYLSKGKIQLTITNANTFLRNK